MSDSSSVCPKIFARNCRQTAIELIKKIESLVAEHGRSGHRKHNIFFTWPKQLRLGNACVRVPDVVRRPSIIVVLSVSLNNCGWATHAVSLRGAAPPRLIGVDIFPARC